MSFTANKRTTGGKNILISVNYKFRLSVKLFSYFHGEKFYVRLPDVDLQFFKCQL